MQSSWWDSVSASGGGGDLGQRIVDVLAPTVRQHINLMNSEGIIVASTDAERIGSEHRAALEVLRTGEAVMVEHEQEGVPDRPGLNLPLRIDGVVSGVVGVTGDRREVEPIARVVVLSVELLIEQERDHRSSFIARNRAREVITALISPAQSEGRIRDLLSTAELGHGPWSLGVWAQLAPQEHGSAEPPEDVDRIVTAINGRWGHTPGHQRVAVVHRGLLWVLAAGPSLPRDLGGAGRRLVVTDIGDLAVLRAWAQDMASLGERVRLLPTDGDGEPPIDLAITVARLPEASLRRLAHTAAALSPAQRAAALALATASSASEAARSLFLHRNTLLQRLQRIRELTGLDLRRPDDAAALRLSLLACACLPENMADST